MPALFSAQRVRIQHIARAKAEGIPLTMLTAYDALTAPILEAAGVDTLIGLGTDAHYYLEGAPGVAHREVASDPEQAARLAIEHAEDGAVILVKGSYGSHSWQVADILREKGTNR